MKPYCADHYCRCHKDARRRVLTPFPLELGPMYCCSLCARIIIMTDSGWIHAKRPGVGIMVPEQVEAARGK